MTTLDLDLLDRLPARPEVAYAGAPHTDEWHAVRRTGLGGSDVAAILGQDDYRDPWMVYTSKVSPELLDEPVSEAAEWGTRLEGSVARWAAEREDATLHEWPVILRDAERPFVLGSLDHLVERDQRLRVLEVKCSGRLSEWQSDRLPPYVEAQARWYLMISGLDEALVAALLGGNRGVLHRIERAERVERLMLGLAEAFWDRVERRDPPAPGSDPRVARALRRQASAPGQIIDLDESWRWSLDRLSTIEQSLADLKDDRERIRNRLMALMGDAEEAYLDGERVATFREHPRGGLDQARLKRDHPEIVEAYRVEATQRPLKITGGDEE